VVSIEKTRFYALISGARSGSSVQWPTSATSATRMADQRNQRN
jgi:hypothetical protein